MDAPKWREINMIANENKPNIFKVETKDQFHHIRVDYIEVNEGRLHLFYMEDRVQKLAAIFKEWSNIVRVTKNV